MNPKIAAILTNISKNLLELRDTLFPPTLGINMAGVVDWSTEIVFNNIMKQSRQWTSEDGKTYNGGPPLPLDVNNYPTSLPTGCLFADSMMMVDNLGTHIPTGPYQLKFDGSGEIRFNGRATGSFTTSGSMVNINPGGAPFLSLQIWKTDPTNPIKNISLIPYGSIDAGYFHPSLINRYKGQYPVVRLMDWMNINDSNNPQVEWADRAMLSDRSYSLGKGVPLEMAIEFCNTVGADPWFCIPHRASNNYVTYFCSLINSRLNPERKVYIEYTNEAWNMIMPQANWCRTQGVGMKLAADDYESQIRFYAKRANEVHRFAQQELGSRLIRVIGAFHKDIRVGMWVLDQIKNDCDAIAIAPYWGHADTLGDLSVATTDTILASCSTLIDSNKAYTINYKSLADKAGIKLFAYEGGQHMFKPDASDSVINLFVAANRDQRIKDLYLKDLRNWKDIGGDLFMAFSSMGVYGRGGCWGMLEYFDQATSPKLDALRQYVA